MIVEEPAALFKTDTLFRGQVVREWRFDGAADLEGWATTNVARWSFLPDGGMRIVAEGGRPALSRDVDINAAEVDAIELDIREVRTGDVRLYWGRAGEDIAAQRSLRLEPRAGRATSESYWFRVSEHPNWDGRIAWLRVFPGSTGGRGVLNAVRAVRVRLEPDRLASAISNSWKVTLDSEIRDARVVLPGSPIAWPVVLRQRDSLRFAYGVAAGIRRPTRFTVQAERPGREAVALFEAELPADGEDGWHEAEVPLDDLDPGAWTLVFETRASQGQLDPLDGAPFIAAPEIVAPPQDDQPPNVLLVSLDTLRADHLSSYGYSRVTSPNLDEWASRSAVLFENAIVSFPGTLPSHASMLSGLWPFATGLGHAGKVPRSVDLLAERFRRAGFHTRAITGGTYLHPAYGFEQGFDVFRYWTDPGAPAERELEDSVDRFVRWVTDGPAPPWFFFLHTYEVHTPFRARQPFLEQYGGPSIAGGDLGVSYAAATAGGSGPDAARMPVLLGTDPPRPVSRDELIAAYDAGVRYTDQQLGRVLTALRTANLDRDTIIVVTSDHGESLGEGGRLGHGNLYDTDLHAPLMIALPRGERGGTRVTDQVSTVDLVPTLIELAGLPEDPELDGISRVPDLYGQQSAGQRDAWSYSHDGVALRISSRLKYIYRYNVLRADAGEEELYDLVRDPLEENNLAAVDGEVAALRRRAREHTRRTHRGLRMDFENVGSELLEVDVRSQLFAPGGIVISPEMPCPCIRMARPSTARITVPPGQRFQLFFMMMNPDTLELTGTVADRAFNTSLDVEGVTQDPLRYVWDGRGWRESSSAVEGALRFSIWREGILGEPPSAPQVDAELLERLRALGYLR